MTASNGDKRRSTGVSLLGRVARHTGTLYPPALSEEPRNLFTVAYANLIDALADVLFPPSRAESNGPELRASDARVDRYIFFQAAWDPAFGSTVQLALRDLAHSAYVRHKQHFVDLESSEVITLLTDLESSRLAHHEWESRRDQQATFRLLHSVVAEGLMADPGYGGNHRGLGWSYSQFNRGGGNR